MKNEYGEIINQGDGRGFTKKDRRPAESDIPAHIKIISNNFNTMDMQGKYVPKDKR